MTTGPATLQGAPTPDRSSFRPQFFRLAQSEDKARLSELFRDVPGIEVHDTILGQLQELVRSLNPSLRYSAETLREAALAHAGQGPLDEYGVWVHYPWSRRLVHLLDEFEFALVRTDRNRNKITREEQALLATKKIGVIGLSVGQSVCITLAQERSFGELRIADFDLLELNNLNRIRTGTHYLGVNKAVIVAREIMEIDPFLKVTLFTEGLTKENIHAFFTEGGKLDIVVDECDGVDVKILCRQKARELGVAVVMDTSDRGLVDIERFDLEPARPLLHGLIDHLDPNAAALARTNEEKLPFLIPMAGLETLSPRMKASMVELGQSITTWPQLASAVVLGGALAGDICRRIALGHLTTSGRWWVDLEEVISDRSNRTDPDATSQKVGRLDPLSVDESIQIAERVDPIRKGGLQIDPSKAELIAEAGALAPSAGNMQPWSFLLHEGRLMLFHDTTRSFSALDPAQLIAHIGLGACLENMVLRGASLGATLTARLFPLPDEPRLVAVLEQDDPTPEPAPLAEWLGIRHTNRRNGDTRPLEDPVIDALCNSVSTVDGATVSLLNDRKGIASIANICGAAERIRILNTNGQREFFAHEVRWTPEEAARRGDGLDIETLELTLSGRTGFRVASDPRAMALVSAWNAGKGLERHSFEAVSSSSAVALVSMPSQSLVHRIGAGRAMQRLWLVAAQHGLAVHPVSAPIFLAHHLRHSGGSGLSPRERRDVANLHDLVNTTFTLQGREPLFLVRLSHAEKATARSLRRPLASMFHHATFQTI